jgi:hypothetical protein
MDIACFHGLEALGIMLAIDQDESRTRFIMAPALRDMQVHRFHAIAICEARTSLHLARQIRCCVQEMPLSSLLIFRSCRRQHEESFK